MGFYLANAFVLNLGPHSTLQDLSLTLSASKHWIELGVVSGPVMGAVGAWAIRRGRLTLAAIAAVSLLFEPVAVYLAYVGSYGHYAAGDGAWNGVYAAEAAIGAVAAVLLWRARVARGRSPQRPI